jgi:hypothetical protein
MKSTWKIQKRGRKVLEKSDKKLQCFAFRGGRGCTRAAKETGLCGCKPCIIRPSQMSGYDRFVSLLAKDNHIAARHWRTEMHIIYKADFVAENEQLIKESIVLLAEAPAPVKTVRESQDEANDWISAMKGMKMPK